MAEELPHVTQAHALTPGMLTVRVFVTQATAVLPAVL